jgi:hypothetical protein
VAMKERGESEMAFEVHANHAYSTEFHSLLVSMVAGALPGQNFDVPAGHPRIVPMQLLPMQPRRRACWLTKVSRIFSLSVQRTGPRRKEVKIKDLTFWLTENQNRCSG